MTDPLALSHDLREAYLRYYDTAFWLRDPRLVAERRALLEAEGHLFADPLIEPVLPYPATEPLSDVAARAAADADAVSLVGRALLGDFTAPGEEIRLRPHQADALRHSLPSGAGPGRNVVVTSGTGSGKTESFLLPVLTRLVQEARPGPPNPSRTCGGTRRRPRPGGRYGRLRRDRPRSGRWCSTRRTRWSRTRWRACGGRSNKLHQELPDRPLWFGRYTGITLGSTTPPPRGKSEKVAEVAAELRA